MFEKKDRIVYLISKHFRNDLTSGENKELEDWLSENEEHRKLLSQFSDDNIMEEKMKLFLHSEIPDAWAKVQQRITDLQPVVKKKNPIRNIINLTAAAVFLLAFLGVAFFLWDKNKNQNNPEAKTLLVQPNRVLPQLTNKAELTLTNGSKVLLHKIKDGLIEIQGAYKVLKHQEDLYYKVNGAYVPVEKDLYNIVTTPRGGQYRIIFADGSAISMNVASSLTFNVSSPVRKVDLRGEAEFEIAHNSDNTPFWVKIPSDKNHGNEGNIEVTGTRFNINAYEDDTEKKITLLDGLVKVYTRMLQVSELSTASYLEKAKKILKPGDQAQLQENGSINVIHQVDTAAVVSWKKGYVDFNQTSTRKVLSTIEKWYDVKVIYNTKKVPEYLFTGKITPKTDIETVLEIMQFQCDDLHVKFDGTKRQIEILP
jgi:transmembrane sensor